MMNKVFFYASLFLLAACSSSNEESNEIESTVVKADTIFLPTIYDPFYNDELPLILEEMGVCYCDTFEPGELIDSCDHKIFRIINYKDNESLDDGFILESKGRWFNRGARRRTVVFDNVKGEVHRINDYEGELLEMIPQEGKPHDLILRYFKPGLGTVTILHKWYKEGYYMPEEVIEINDHFVKEEAKDSLNIIYIEEFPWGM